LIKKQLKNKSFRTKLKKLEKKILAPAAPERVLNEIERIERIDNCICNYGKFYTIVWLIQPNTHINQ